MIIGFIGFGEVNYKLNSILSSKIKTITSYENRSENTISKIKNSEIEIVDSFIDVAQNADLVIDSTSPKQALENARKYSKYVKGLYLDLNNISPTTTKEITSYFNGNFIDGAIIGKIDSFKPNIIVSGENAFKLDFLNDYKIDLKIISNEVGDASTLKMLRSSYTKSLSAILIESVDLAKSLNLEDEFFDILAISEGEDFKAKSISRILNTKKHSKRKIEELDELLELFKNEDTKMIKSSKEKLKKI